LPPFLIGAFLADLETFFRDALAFDFALDLAMLSPMSKRSIDPRGPIL
jgi:hypothetical protein